MNLFISDLDGTLLNKNEEISKESIEIINDLINQGLNFSVATARSLEGAKHILAPLNLKLPIVTFNGVEVYCPVEKRIINDNYLDIDTAMKLLETLETYDIDPFIFTRNMEGVGKVYYKGEANFGQQGYMNSGANVDKEYFESVEGYDIIKGKQIISLAGLEKEEKLHEVYEKLKDLPGLQVHFTEDIYLTGYYWLEFGKFGSSKKGGVEFVKKHVNATKLIAFGDNLNDISMFMIADEKYAVGNARDELKKISTSIIGKNIDNGVALFIQDYFRKI